MTLKNLFQANVKDTGFIILHLGEEKRNNDFILALSVLTLSGRHRTPPTPLTPPIIQPLELFLGVPADGFIDTSLAHSLSLSLASVEQMTPPLLPGSHDFWQRVSSTRDLRTGLIIVQEIGNICAAAHDTLKSHQGGRQGENCRNLTLVVFRYF